MNIIQLLSDDLLSLYCKVGNKNIEDLYVKIASASMVEIEEFFNNKANILELNKLVKNTDVVASIVALISLKKEYPAGITRQDRTSILFNAKYQKYIQYYIILSKLCAKYNLLSLLSNYITSFKDLQLNNFTSLNEGDIDSDLSIIQSYVDNKYNVEEEPEEDEDGLGNKRHISLKMQKDIAKVEMYFELLNRFTEELSEQAKLEGKDSMSEVINGGGLSSIYEMSKNKSVSIYKITDKDKNKIRALMLFILKNYGKQYVDKNYEYIKSEILESNMMMPVSDPLSRSNRSELDYVSIGRFNVNQEKRKRSIVYNNSIFLQRENITLLVHFFFLYKKEIAKIIDTVPSDFMSQLVNMNNINVE